VKRDVVETELQRIWDEHHRLIPAEIVQLARVVDHPLHDCFDWSDREAAQNWREHQAATLIRSVRIVVSTVDDSGHGTSFNVRRYLAAYSAGASRPVESGYFPTGEVLDTATRQVLLRQFQRDWAAFRRRWEGLAEFWSILDTAHGEHEQGAA
jgi:hypothetical protein